ncbi:3-isopropylmalate dehydratase [Priestia aryabhattai]|uniref:3-isopropylmalate dehydratase n=1 Tax=Priestia aryabhattai TaxID=412384 RepID=UPI0027E4A9B8|nr:3-isopropylmalate dehydratase [Priestia aryabhattai]WJX01827.1 3-isopropylmalate dehydratase [Priestia aryabhattai]
MSIISIIPYTYVERKIKRTQKVTIQHSKDMCLYKVTIQHSKDMCLYTDNIQTENDCFHINSIFDISYKCVSKESGFLYLHTNQGMFAYTIHTDPAAFIAAYKDIKKKG